MTKYRYTRWEDTPDQLDADADALLDDLERYLISKGDLDAALRSVLLGKELQPPDQLLKIAEIPDDDKGGSTGEILSGQAPEAQPAETDRLQKLARILEEAGYIQWNNELNRYELTARGIRKIGQKVLADIFAGLRLDRMNGRNLNLQSVYGDRTDETKAFEFGDDLALLHIQRTILNAIKRKPTKPPMKLAVQDFEVYREEAVTRSATVLMLDLSRSMPRGGNFEAGKRVAIALDSLIRSQFPKDKLHIIGFSSLARPIKKGELIATGWDDLEPFTNIQHGLYMARKILSRERSTNKQIIMITDGEPTAYLSEGHLFTVIAPTERTIQVTLQEVRNCTQNGIMINTFMLESDPSLASFVTEMSRINRGKVFFTSADNLGQYLLVDYISNKTKQF